MDVHRDSGRDGKWDDERGVVGVHVRVGTWPHELIGIRLAIQIAATLLISE